MTSDEQQGLFICAGSVAFAVYVYHCYSKGEFTYRGIRFSREESKIPFFFMIGLMFVLSLIGFLCGVGIYNSPAVDGQPSL